MNKLKAGLTAAVTTRVQAQMMRNKSASRGAKSKNRFGLKRNSLETIVTEHERTSSLCSMVSEINEEFEQSGFFEHFKIEMMHTLKCVVITSLKDRGRRFLLKKLND